LKSRSFPWVFQDDLRVEVALVLHDSGGRCRWLPFPRASFRFDDILVADLSAHLGEDGDAVRVPLAERGADLDLLIS